MRMTEELPVALVTGSTSGIGLAIAQRLALGGYRVALHSRRESEASRRAVSALNNAAYFPADLLNDSERSELVGAVVRHFGRLNVLVNNAGESAIILHKDLLAASPEIWHLQYELHVVAPWHLIALAAPHLRATSTPERPASVLNISSHAGVRPKGASIPYAASKAALNHVTRLLAKTIGPEIRVNALAPGLVDTPLTQDWQDIREKWTLNAPMRRSATPQDIAELAWMLTESTYLTGEIVVADGGMNLL